MNDVLIIQFIPSSRSTNHPAAVMGRALMKCSNNYLSWWIWAVYAVLAGISIPWYWPAGDTLMLLGFPLWAVVSVLGSLAVSSFTAWLFVCRWPQDDEEDEA